jgi:hypothetical protein
MDGRTTATFLSFRQISAVRCGCFEEAWLVTATKSSDTNSSVSSKSPPRKYKIRHADMIGTTPGTAVRFRNGGRQPVRLESV